MFKLACGLYDQLEVLSMRKTTVEISYIDENGGEILDKGIITDIIAKGGVEYIIFNDDTQIKTQDIIKVNSLVFK